MASITQTTDQPSASFETIEGCQVHIKAPHGPHAQDNLNRKQRLPYFQLQAICHSTGICLDICVGFSPRHQGAKKQYLVDFQGLLPTSWKLHSVGLGILTATVNLITPTPQTSEGENGDLLQRSPCQSPDNYREGLVWNCPQSREGDHTFANEVAAVCALLHNMCITAGDILEMKRIQWHSHHHLWRCTDMGTDWQTALQEQAGSPKPLFLTYAAGS